MVPALLVCVGRRPNTDRLDAVPGGLELDEDGHIVTDSAYRTSVPGVWALGDAVQVPGAGCGDGAGEQGEGFGWIEVASRMRVAASVGMARPQAHGSDLGSARSARPPSSLSVRALARPERLLVTPAGERLAGREVHRDLDGKPVLRDCGSAIGPSGRRTASARDRAAGSM
ncbi:FAD-dependent oxidoreductase [Streptomyces adustus]